MQMRKSLRFGFALIAGTALAAHPSFGLLHVTFDELPLPGSNLYWNGSDGAGGFVSRCVAFTNTFSFAWGEYWAGFAYSKVNNTNTAGYGNQYAVIRGTGYGGAGNYAVGYDDGAGSAVVTLPYPTEVKGFRACNTTYAALDMRNGSGFSKKFGGATGNDPDWFLLTITGRDASGHAVGSNTFYLADFRFPTNSQDYMVTDWTWVSLTNLGSSVKSLGFSLSSSDNSFGWMNTPAFLALDDLQYTGVFSRGLGDPDNPHDPGVSGFVGGDGTGAVSSNNAVNPVFFAWATAVTNYLPAPGVDADWLDATKALGPVTGNNFDIVALGDLDAGQIASNARPGEITLTFGKALRNRAGADFAVFENAFGLENDLFADLAYVEVSSDGTNFARFPSVSQTADPVDTYGTINPAEVYNLAGKHINNGFSTGQSWGTPFDLSELIADPLVSSGKVNLDDIHFVKIVDIPGTGDFRDSEGYPIYDGAAPISSGGFDLEAVGLMRPAVRIAIATNRIAEGDGGTDLTVSRDEYFARIPLTVGLHVEGTASNGTDYALVTNSLRFQAGETVCTLRVNAAVDDLGEGEETAAFALVPGDAYTVDGAETVTVTIADYLFEDGSWTRIRLPDRPESLVNYGTALAHLPDGRCVFGAAGALYLQSEWDGSNWLAFANAPATDDPSFIAVWNDAAAAVGAGGWGGRSPIYGFAPSDTNTPFTAGCTNFNYAGVFRDATNLYVVGGDYGGSKVRLLSLDGSAGSVLVDPVSKFSGGIALDAQGRLYVGSPDDGRVYRFTRAQLDGTASNGPLNLAVGEFVHQFVYNGATNVLGSLAVDGRGCVWAAGWNVNGLQVFDPGTGATARYVPALDNGNYTVAAFTCAGRRYVAYVDLAGYEAGAAQYYGYALADGAANEIGIRTVDAIASELGPVAGTVRVTRRSWSVNLALAVDLDFAGTAVNGVDYSLVTNRLTLGAGVYDLDILIAPVPDDRAQGTRSAVVRVLPGTNCVIYGESVATIRIDDKPVDGWRKQHFQGQANSPLAADDADWDGDGVVNLMEYVLNGDPTLAVSAPRLRAELTPTNVAPSDFAVVYVRRKSLPDVTAGVEALFDLPAGGWAASNVVENVIAADPDTETVRATLTVPAQAGFMRLKAARK